LCAIAVLLVVARTMVLDSATMQMKTGEFDRAATKLKSLANIGDSTAQSLVGDLYAYGWGVSKDDETAVYWYRRAGPLGPPDQAGPPVSDAAAPAMYYVGKRYMEGLGVKHDENEARKWFVRSANGGFSKADEELKRMH
jgi:TPR repeat protein